MIMESKSNIQILEKVQTASAQTGKMFEEPNKFAQKSETASRKFNRPYYASWLPLSWYHYTISQTVSAISETKFKKPKINKSIYLNNELKRTLTNSNCMSSFQFVPVRCINYLMNRTWIRRIITYFWSLDFMILLSHYYLKRFILKVIRGTI